MRVLFLTLYPDAAASPRYRVAQFLPYLRAHGVECHVAAPLTENEWRRLTGPGRRGRALWYHAYETPRRLAQILGARRYDVVFLQKAVMSAYVRGFDRLLRRFARRLVLDLDDAVHLAPPHPLRAPWRILEVRDQVRRLMASAELVLAGNRWLESEVEAAGGRATHFPTVVDTDRFAPALLAPEDYTLGWMGSPATTPHLDLIAPLLQTQQAARVILAGADRERLAWLRPGAVSSRDIEFRSWAYEREVEDVRSFSVGLAPQPKDEWTRGKCALKALLCMACGVPCVATPYGAVLDIIRNGENGLFADTIEDWRTALEKLRDPEMRKGLGAEARVSVEKNYALRTAAPRLLEILESIA